MKDIAILGGSFNPVHNGHIAMAASAHKMYGVDVILMPNKTTYYKENKVFVPDEDRIAMLQLCAEDNDYLSVSDMEIRRGGITHTIDTIREFKQQDSSRTVYFIIGGDSLEWVDKWVEADELLRITHFLTCIRGETDRSRTEEIVRRLKTEHPGSQIDILDTEEMPISSTDIRNRVASGLPITGLVPEKVKGYIIRNKLYS